MSNPSYDSWVPGFRLYDETGLTLLFTFTAVQDTNIPQNPEDTVTITNFRSSGAVVIGGGNKPFEGFLKFWLFSDTVYSGVITDIDSMYSVITVNTPFVLQIDKTPSTYYSYNVKRLVDFDWSNISTDLRQYRQEVTLKLLCNAW